eukprot:TRINITY_DN4994_c0_g1_i1.p1 TRINITY_DN4994_c0_g1~~TRINITY_DN4994_c0_g1_i1.p1  ORF type:complete len:132 (-),score=10.67 TRINITY_DN4994_c0_g1_i1:2-397(-)
MLIEEWRIIFEPNKPGVTEVLELRTFHKRLLASIRALYSSSRVMPAQKLRKDLIKIKTTPFSLRYELLTSDKPSPLHNFDNHLVRDLLFGSYTSTIGALSIKARYRTDIKASKNHLRKCQLIIEEVYTHTS